MAWEVLRKKQTRKLLKWRIISPHFVFQKVNDVYISLLTPYSTPYRKFVYIDASDGGDIAAELEDLMDDRFDTILEDDSADEIGQLLFDLSRKWSAGEKDYVINYVQKSKKDVVKNHISSELNSEVTEGMVSYNSITAFAH